MQILEPEAFSQWRASPLTQEFLLLLSKRRDNLKEAWAQGQPLTVEQQAQAVLLGRLAQVSFDDVRDFAGLDPLDEA
jgi:hypothetical protein